MSKSILREGGRYNVRRTSPDEFSLSVPVKTDDLGMVERSCPDDQCCPGVYKVKFGTGITDEGYDRCFCPYCRQEGDPSDALPEAHRKYLETVLLTEVEKGIGDMFEDALDLDSGSHRRIGSDMFSMEMRLERKHRPPPLPPRDETLRRDVTCPECGLEHAVFGLATWCPDCGADIFLTHVRADLDVVRKMLDDIPSRKERLGGRVMARDTENALEDVVSIFEAVMKHTYQRTVAPEGLAKPERVGNAFQNLNHAEVLFRDVGIELFERHSPKLVEQMRHTFAKRNPITHSLGVVDRRFVDQGETAKVGTEVNLTVEEVLTATEFVESVASDTYARLTEGRKSACKITVK